MENIRLKKRLKRKNTEGREAFYWPRAVSFQKGLEPGTRVLCLEDAVGTTPKLVKVARFADIRAAAWVAAGVRPPRAAAESKGDRLYDTFIVLLEDLTE